MFMEAWPNAEKKKDLLGSSRRDCLAGYHFGSVGIKGEFGLEMNNDRNIHLYTKFTYLTFETKP